MKVHTKDQRGALEQSYELETNDPRHPLIKVSVVANVKPVPDYVKRISTADVERGEVLGAFQFWPTARLVITLEPGERFAITLRIRSLAPDAGGLKLPPNAPESWKIRRDANGSDYWLDITIEPANASSLRTVPLVVELSDGRTREIRVQLMINVPAENLVVTPRELDFGELTLVSAKDVVKRVGVRKLVGSFHIKAVSSTLPYLKLEQATMVEGSNYLIRATIDPTRHLKAGAYNGVLLIETDDGNRLEVPVKIKLVAR